MKNILLKVGMCGNKHHIVELSKKKNHYWPNGIQYKTLRSFVLDKEDFNELFKVGISYLKKEG